MCPCLMCWAGSRWCRAEGNGAVLSGWHPPEHSGLSAWEVTARAWCWRGDGKEETGGITELVPGAHSSHNNNVTDPLAVLCCQWNGGICLGSSDGGCGECRDGRGAESRTVQGSFTPPGQRKRKCGCFPVLTSQKTTWELCATEPGLNSLSSPHLLCVNKQLLLLALPVPPFN